MILNYGKGITMKETYSHKIKLPIFEPSNRNVTLDECVNVDQFVKYMEEIDRYKSENKINEQQYKFLKLAASRFIVFNFENIAEYFCHANADMQRIMQNLALVLLDYDDALKTSIIETVDFTNKVLGIQERYKNEMESLDNVESEEW